MSRLREHPISEGDFEQWLNNRITQQLVLELTREYFLELDTEPVVKARIVNGGTFGDRPVHGYASNPVEETAINAAISSGRLSVLEDWIRWEPDNLEIEENDDD